MAAPRMCIRVTQPPRVGWGEPAGASWRFALFLWLGQPDDAALCLASLGGAVDVIQPLCSCRAVHAFWAFSVLVLVTLSQEVRFTSPRERLSPEVSVPGGSCSVFCLYLPVRIPLRRGAGPPARLLV